MSSLSTRTKMVGAMIGAFLCGLVFASGLDLTSLGYAQQSRSLAAAQVSRAANVAPASVEALNGSFVDLAERLTPAVVSIDASRSQRTAQREQPRVPRGFREFFDQFDVPQQPSQAATS
jgi:S1-C subfamily serine protease